MIRFAGKALLGGGRFLLNNMGNTPVEKLLRLGPDVGFGILAGVQTPGDIGDKLIAGGTQAAGGILGGIGTAGGIRAATRGMNPGLSNALQTLGDMGGSVAGDFAGMAVGDQVMRGKDVLMGGSGQTAWERMGAEEQALFARQLEQQILAQYGIIPGTREQYAIDPTTGMGVA